MDGYRTLQKRCLKAKKEKRLRKTVSCKGKAKLSALMPTVDRRLRADYTVAELRRKAAARGVRGRSKMNRAQLVRALGLGYPRSSASVAARPRRRRVRRSHKK